MKKRPDLEAARARAKAARDRLDKDAEIVRGRLAPRELVRDAIDSAGRYVAKRHVPLLSNAAAKSGTAARVVLAGWTLYRFRKPIIAAAKAVRGKLKKIPKDMTHE